jgi:hypothetical protein
MMMMILVVTVVVVVDVYVLGVCILLFTSIVKLTIYRSIAKLASLCGVVIGQNFQRITVKERERERERF